MASDGIKLPSDSTVISQRINTGQQSSANHSTPTQTQTSVPLTTPLATVVLEAKTIIEGAKGSLFELVLQNDPKSQPPITVQSDSYVKPGTTILLELDEQQNYRSTEKPSNDQLTKLVSIELDYWRAHVLPKADNQAQQAPTLNPQQLQQLATRYPPLQPLVNWLTQQPESLNGNQLQQWISQFTPLSSEKPWPQPQPVQAPAQPAATAPPTGTGTEKGSQTTVPAQTPLAQTANQTQQSTSTNSTANNAAATANTPLKPELSVPAGSKTPLQQPIATEAAKPEAATKPIAHASGTASNNSANVPPAVSTTVSNQPALPRTVFIPLTTLKPESSATATSTSSNTQVSATPQNTVPPAQNTQAGLAASALQPTKNEPPVPVPNPATATNTNSSQPVVNQTTTEASKPMPANTQLNTQPNTASSSSLASSSNSSLNSSLNRSPNNSPNTLSSNSQLEPPKTANSHNPAPSRADKAEPSHTQNQQKPVPLEITLSQWINTLNQLMKSSPNDMQALLKQAAAAQLNKAGESRVTDSPVPNDQASPNNQATSNNSVNTAQANEANEESAQLLNLRNWLENSQARLQNMAIQTTAYQWSAPDQPPVQQMQLPLIWLGLTSWADIEWWQERPKKKSSQQSNDEESQQHWRMRIYLKMDPLARVCADIDYHSSHTNLTFWSEDRATLAHMNTLLGHLEQWTAGLGERTLQTKHGMPKKVETEQQHYRDNHLVDVRT